MSRVWVSSRYDLEVGAGLLRVCVLTQTDELEPDVLCSGEIRDGLQQVPEVDAVPDVHCPGSCSSPGRLDQDQSAETDLLARFVLVDPQSFGVCDFSRSPNGSQSRRFFSNSDGEQEWHQTKKPPLSQSRNCCSSHRVPPICKVLYNTPYIKQVGVDI